MDYQADGTVQRRRSLVSLLFVPLLAFVGGLALMGWVLTRSGTADHWFGLVRAADVPAPAPPPPVTVQKEPAPVATQIAPPGDAGATASGDPELLRRVNRMEEKVTQLDLQARAAVGNADRAESLLVAFAARRALDRGLGLGYLETLLRQRFATTEPQAVATIFTAARAPVTLEQLQAELQDLTPKLTGGGPDQGWWEAFRTELAGLISIRKEGTPSPLPSEHLRRAQSSLQAGQVDVALVEVSRLPGRANAAEWIEKARRYVGARRALDTIETSALMEPPPPAPAPPAKAAPPPPAAKPPAVKPPAR
jgi:hypothetical protein